MSLELALKILERGPDFVLDPELVVWVEENSPARDNILERGFHAVRKFSRHRELKKAIPPGDEWIIERLYQCITGRTSPICQYGKQKKFSSNTLSYGFCGTQNKCRCFEANRLEGLADTDWSARNQKHEATMMERYGVTSSLQMDKTREGNRQYRKVGTDTHASLIEKTRKTNIERYGVMNPMQNSEVIGKSIETCKMRYGVSNPSQNENIKDKKRETLKRNFDELGMAHPDITEKRNQTNMDCRGVRNPMQDPQIREAVRATNMERYGVENPAQCAVVKERTIATNLSKYGVPYIGASEEVKKNIAATNMERYGYKSSFSSKEVQARYRQNNLDKYGVEHPMQNSSIQINFRDSVHLKFGVSNTAQIHFTEKARAILFDKEKFTNVISEMSAASLAVFCEIDQSTVYDYCKKYNILLQPSTSSYENEIAYFFDSNAISYGCNIRGIIGRKELDFYLPDQSLAIEFNGVYWHSDQKIDPLYHRRKYQACRDAGIRLISINEDEWIERSEAIKLKLLSLVGLGDRGIGARKLKVSVISSKEANTFIDRHHIQGRTGSITAAMGAYDGNHLVGVIAFNRQRGTQKIELIRFCSDGKNYPGMFSKLFKKSVNEFSFTEVISFADLRYSIGDVYEKNGFVLTSEIKPDYRYVKGQKTYHKSTFTKTQIQRKFGIDMSALTEKEAMKQLGYSRIWDCGKLRYIWKKPVK